MLPFQGHVTERSARLGQLQRAVQIAADDAFAQQVFDDILIAAFAGDPFARDAQEAVHALDRGRIRCGTRLDAVRGQERQAACLPFFQQRDRLLRGRVAVAQNILHVAAQGGLDGEFPALGDVQQFAGRADDAGQFLLHHEAHRAVISFVGTFQLLQELVAGSQFSGIDPDLFYDGRGRGKFLFQTAALLRGLLQFPLDLRALCARCGQRFFCVRQSCGKTLRLGQAFVFLQALQPSGQRLLQVLEAGDFRCGRTDRCGQFQDGSPDRVQFLLLFRQLPLHLFHGGFFFLRVPARVGFALRYEFRGLSHLIQVGLFALQFFLRSRLLPFNADAVPLQNGGTLVVQFLPALDKVDLLRHAGQFCAQLVQRRFRLRVFLPQTAQLCFQFGARAAVLFQDAVQFLHLRTHGSRFAVGGLDVLQDDIDLHVLVFVADLEIFRRFFRFFLQVADAAFDLGHDVVDPRQVLIGAFQPAFRLRFLVSVFDDAGCFFEDFAAAVHLVADDVRDLALADDGIPFHADARIHDELTDIPQPARRAVDHIFALAGAVHAAGDAHFRVIDGERVVGIIDDQRHLGQSLGLAALGAGEDDLLHLSAAEHLRALLAQHPADRVGNVGFSGSVRADDAGHPLREFDCDRICKGFESIEFHAFEVHSLPLGLKAFQSGCRRLLFRFFLALSASFSRRFSVGVYGGRKDLGVVRPALRDDLVTDLRIAVLRGSVAQQFLQRCLGVLGKLAALAQIRRFAQALADDRVSRVETAVQIGRAYDRFHAVRDDGDAVSAASALFAPAQKQEFVDAQFLPGGSQGTFADDGSAHLRQIALFLIRIAVVQLQADAGSQNRVAQEFQPFVAFSGTAQFFVGVGAVGHSPLQQLFVPEFVSDDLFQLTQLHFPLPLP